jgi:branched-chain amino acid aminotransferase
VPALDRGLLFGDGVFETLRAYGGVVFRLERHLERLRRSMDGLELRWEADDATIRTWIEELLVANDLGPASQVRRDARLRLTVTGGLSDGRIRLARANPPTVLISAEPLVPVTEAVHAAGIALATSEFRQPWASPLARIKTIHRLEYLMAREAALRRGADDGLILDDRGHVAEGTASNVALVTGSIVATPSLDGPILAGVTREAVLEAAVSAGFGVEERTVDPGEFRNADEAFATSTSWEVLAVRSIDGAAVGAGRRGPVTAAIHDSFRRLVAAETGRQDR